MSKENGQGKERKSTKDKENLTVDESLKIIENRNEENKQNVKQVYDQNVQSKHKLNSYFCYTCGSVLTTKEDMNQHLLLEKEREMERERNNH